MSSTWLKPRLASLVRYSGIGATASKWSALTRLAVSRAITFSKGEDSLYTLRACTSSLPTLSYCRGACAPSNPKSLSQHPSPPKPQTPSAAHRQHVGYPIRVGHQTSSKLHTDHLSPVESNPRNVAVRFQNTKNRELHFHTQLGKSVPEIEWSWCR